MSQSEVKLRISMKLKIITKPYFSIAISQIRTYYSHVCHSWDILLCYFERIYADGGVLCRVIFLLQSNILYACFF